MLSVRIPLEILHMGGKLFIFFLLSHPIAREDAAIWRLDIILCSIFIKHISKTNWFLICQYQWKPNRKVILPIKYLILILSFRCFLHIWVFDFQTFCYQFWIDPYEKGPNLAVFRFFHLNIFHFNLQIRVLRYQLTM